MNRFIVYVVAVVVLLIAVSQAVPAQEMQDVVYLKNGGIIRGVIIEQVPGKSIKIQTRDGSVFVHQLDEVERITKEGAPQSAQSGGGPGAGQFGVVGHVGTDISGGLGFGGGLSYILTPGGASYGYEFAVDYFFHEYEWAEGGEREFTDLSIFAFRTNWLWNYQPNQSHVYFITGVGFVFAALDYVIEYDASVYGQFSSESYDYTSVGNVINLGVGYTSDMGLGVRLETPMLFLYSAGQASAFVPTFTLGVKFIF
jgi:hypothetical protein